MTVQCPRCRTQYKIPSERINDSRPVFKCTRCSLVFSSEPERAARGGKRKADDTLPLPFESRKASGRAKPPIEVDEEAPTIRSARDAAPDDEVETLADDEAEETEESDEDTDGDDETEDEDGDASEDSGDDDEDQTEAEDDEEEADEEPAKAPARRARGPSRPRRARAADDDDAQEPAFARAERQRAERAEAERERERIAAEKERLAEEKARAAAEKERARIAAEKERERQRAAAEREKERARIAAEKERARAAEARRREREELRLREEEDEDVEDDGPDDLGDEDDDEPQRPVLRASESKQRRAPINPRRGIRSAAAAAPSKSPLKTVTIGVTAIALVYLATALWLSSSSEAAIATLSRVPVLGSLLGGDHLLVWRLQLTDVDGALDQIKGGRPAYVVSGRAVNTSNEDLRVIEIEGRLLVNGVEQRRQTVYAANQQRKTIQDLSPSEVEMLLRLEPNRRFSIRPGESASFLLVFPNPPPGTTEVTCRVVDARNS